MQSEKNGIPLLLRLRSLVFFSLITICNMSLRCAGIYSHIDFYLEGLSIDVREGKTQIDLSYFGTMEVFLPNDLRLIKPDV